MREKVEFRGDGERFLPGISALCPELGIVVAKGGICVDVRRQEKGLSVEFQNGRGSIGWTREVEFFRGLGILCGMIRRNEEGRIEEKPVFERAGVMFDVSRNAVLKPESMKRLLRKMALMGLCVGMVYTEDTYEVPQEPYFGYLRGRYSQKELKEMDDYAALFGIELVPCIQTLGHLSRVLQWSPYESVKDTEEILLAGCGETYALLEKMIVSASAPYRSRRIHIGMDEAEDLGLGNFLKKYGWQKASSIMEVHLKKVGEILKKHGLCGMMWSDMYLKMASPSGNYYDVELPLPEEIRRLAPEDLSLVCWDYYHHREEEYEELLKRHKEFAPETIFACGIWKWSGPNVSYEQTERSMYPGLEAAKKAGIQEVFAAAWGDDGAEADPFAALYGMQMLAEYCYRKSVRQEEVRQRFWETAGADGTAFYRLSEFDAPSCTEGIRRQGVVYPLCKILLYEDPLLPLFEADVRISLEGHYRKLCVDYRKYAENHPEYESLFGFYAALAEVLAEKCAWREHAAKAVREKNRAEAGRLADTVQTVLDSLRGLKDCWRRLWYEHHKPFGFEVIDLRLGGLASRMETAGIRMRQFAEGKTDDVEELSEEKLPFRKQAMLWENMVSASRISGM